jgi:hypothetical protein
MKVHSMQENVCFRFLSGSDLDSCVENLNRLFVAPEKQFPAKDQCTAKFKFHIKIRIQ